MMVHSLLTLPSSSKAKGDRAPAPCAWWPLYSLLCGLSVFLTWTEVTDIGNPRQMQGGWRERFMMHPRPTIRPHGQREQAE